MRYIPFFLDPNAERKPIVPVVPVPKPLHPSEKMDKVFDPKPEGYDDGYFTDQPIASGSNSPSASTGSLTPRPTSPYQDALDEIERNNPFNES